MKPLVFATVAGLICFPSSCLAEDDGGFHSIAEHRAVDPAWRYYPEHQNIDDLFDTRDIVNRLAKETRVRLFRIPSSKYEDALIYFDLERKDPLRARLGKQLPTVELTKEQFGPVLKLASDYDNYGDITECGFDPGVAVLIGDDEPEYVLICCFKCHDIHVVRRPTATNPMPRIAQIGMSPELELAIFRLAQAAYPADKNLQSFKLFERHRSKTPLTRPPKDPLSVDSPKATNSKD